MPLPVGGSSTKIAAIDRSLLGYTIIIISFIYRIRFQLIKEWKVAASAFCILCLLLRVKELRSLQLMLDAVKEGRRFLSLFAKNRLFFLLTSKIDFQFVYVCDGGAFSFR